MGNLMDVKGFNERLKESVEQANRVFAKFAEDVRTIAEGLNLDEKAKMVELSELAAGEEFCTEIGNFIVLEQLEGSTKVITKGLYLKSIEFDQSSTDYKNSDLKKICDGKIYEKFCEVFGKENIIQHEVDLTTLDGQQAYGTAECYVRPLTFDEARKYNALLVNKELPKWYWTCTAWSTADRGWARSVSVVSSSGDIDCGDCNGGGVRPFCILKSNIFVSKEDK